MGISPKRFSVAFIVTTCALFTIMQVSVKALPIVPARIFVSDCVVENDGLILGSTGEVSFLLENTSSRQSVYSVMVTTQWQNSTSPLAEFDMTNQVFIPEIKPHEIVPATFHVSTKAVELASVKSIECSLLISYYTSNILGTNAVVNETTGEIIAAAVSDNFELYTNNVMVRVPVRMNSAQEVSVLATENEPNDDNDEGNWDIWQLSQSQIVYIWGFLVCVLIIFMLLLYLVRRFLSTPDDLGMANAYEKVTPITLSV